MLEENVIKVPKPVKLNLPKIKKISLPKKPKKIQLPKIKKIES